jgi:hypothetical protein
MYKYKARGKISDIAEKFRFFTIAGCLFQDLSHFVSRSSNYKNHSTLHQIILCVLGKTEINPKNLGFTSKSYVLLLFILLP